MLNWVYSRSVVLFWGKWAVNDLSGVFTDIDLGCADGFTMIT
jgi:hypothetical protein